MQITESNLKEIRRVVVPICLEMQEFLHREFWHKFIEMFGEKS
jgi:dynactin complex subunit